VTVDLEALPNVRLYPGMPATVMFPTVERTAFNYLIGPLVMSFNRARRYSGFGVAGVDVFPAPGAGATSQGPSALHRDAAAGRI
jgi:hypothetical protein